MKRYREEHDKLQQFFVIGPEDPSVGGARVKKTGSETNSCPTNDGMNRTYTKQKGAFLDLPDQQRGNDTASI